MGIHLMRRFRPAALVGPLALMLLSACEPVQNGGPSPAVDRQITATLLTAGDGVRVNGRQPVPGQPVRIGDRITTGRDSTALVRFSDRTEVQIIDAVDPVRIEWSGDTLVLRVDDAAVEVEKGFLFRIIEVIGALAHSFHESSFIVEEQRRRFFRIDLFEGRVRFVRPRTGQVLAPGQYAAVTPNGRVEYGRTSPRYERGLRARFDRWDFTRVQRIRMPNLLERSLDDALAEIERQGLRQGRIQGTRDRNSYVADQTPRPNAAVARGDRVDLVLRSRVTTVRVPDVRKLSEAEARRRIEAAGLEVGRVTGARRGERYVVAQEPRANADVRLPARVDLMLEARAIPQILVPDVRRLLLRDAIARIESAGLKVGRIQGGQGGDAYYVVSQSPGPRAPLAPGGQVDLTVRGVIQ